MAKLIKVIAKSNEYMDDDAGEKFCTKRKEYPVIRQEDNQFMIIDDKNDPHYFGYNEEYFDYIYDESEVKETMNKPLLGVTPKKLHEEKRIEDLCRALYDYSMEQPTSKNIDYMHTWAEELVERLWSLKFLIEEDEFNKQSI